MKIKEINTYYVRPRWGFVEIITEDGCSGWGEAVLEGHAHTVLACVEEMKDYLIGAEAGNIEDIWNVLYRAGFYRGGSRTTADGAVRVRPERKTCGDLQRACRPCGPNSRRTHSNSGLQNGSAPYGFCRCSGAVREGVRREEPGGTPNAALLHDGHPYAGSR